MNLLPNGRVVGTVRANHNVRLGLARNDDGGAAVSYRTFLDSTGKRWEVWLVTPAAAERRKVDRRAAATARGEDTTGFADRRLTPDRRKNPFRRSVEVATEYSQGWLCFESEGEKRRLAPVPEGWSD